MAETVPPETLRTPLHQIVGVGSSRATLLARLGIHTLQDALFYFPRDYQTIQRSCAVQDLRQDELASIDGEVIEIDTYSTRSGQSVLGVLLQCGDDSVRGTWFNQPYMLRKFQ